MEGTSPDPAALSRRRLLGVAASCGAAYALGLADLVALASATESPRLPTEVAGIAIPRTPLALSAIEVARRSAPPFLFNHSMRAFVFGQLIARAENATLDPELFMVACAFHDLGMLEAHASPSQPFEMDSADSARRFLTEHGVTGEPAELVWDMIAFHTSPLARQEGPMVPFVGRGAGADFSGGNPAIITERHRRLVVEAFPRLGFRREIQAALLANCRRKPDAQMAWSYSHCRSQAPELPYGSIEETMARSPFAE